MATMWTTKAPMDEPWPSTMVTPSPSAKKESKFRHFGISKSMSRDKAACEFYREEDNLADGDLPTLGAPSTSYMRPSAVHSVDSPAETPPTTRSVTPTVKNKDKRSRGRFRLRKGQAQPQAPDVVRKRNGDEVTIEARRLSPETKRKHKVFWSQMDVNDGNSSTEDEGPDRVPDDRPDDEMQDEKQYLQNTPTPRTVNRETEVVEHGNDTAHGIITLLTDMCADCGWGNDEKAAKESNPDYVRHSSPSTPVPEPIVAGRTRAIIDDDADDDVSGSQQDDASLPSKTALDTDQSKAILDTRQPRVKRNSSTAMSKGAYHTDAFENTAIEVEYYDAGVPDDELVEYNAESQRYVDDTGAPEQELEGFLQLDTSGDVSTFVRPEDDKAASDIVFNVATEKGAYMMSKSKSWSVPDKSAYLQAMAKKAKEDFAKKKAEQRSTIAAVLGEEEKPPQQQQQPNESYEKGLPAAPSGSDNLLRMSRSHEDFASPRSAFSSNTKETEATDFLSPSGVAEFDLSVANRSGDLEITSDVGTGSNKPLLLKKVQSDLPPTSARSVKQTRFASLKNLKPGFKRVDRSGNQQGIDTSYDMDSKGSSRSFRKKKKGKAGDFHEIDDVEPGEEKDIYVQPFNDDVVGRPDDEKKDSRPNDDIFDFDDDGEDHIVNDYAVLSSVKLDPKEDSCDVSMLGSLAQGDSATVASSRSMYTTGTNISNWSTSTRRRHRGAAKHRISEADVDSKRPSGWLESIKVAAEQSNRRWDPKLGWIDYVEPDEKKEEEEVQLNTGRIGRLKTPDFKGAGKGSNSNDDESTRSDGRSASSQALPFPDKWEKDRKRMLRNFDEGASAATEVVSNKPRKQNGNNQAAQGGSDVRIEFDLGAHDTIEECSEEESDSDNKSDSLGPPQESKPGHFSVYSVDTPVIPEKGKLFGWIGDIGSGAEGAQHNDEPKSKVAVDTPVIPEKGKLFGWIGAMGSGAEDAQHNDGPKSKVVGGDRDNRRSSSDLLQKKSSGQESEGDDFGQVNGSFDFSATDSAKDLNEDSAGSFEDDGFEVIQESKGMGFDHKLVSSPAKKELQELEGKRSALGLEKKKIKPSRISKELQEVGEKMTGLVDRPFKISGHVTEADRSVMSTNSTTSKAKDWVKKVEEDKKKIPKSTHSAALFVSAVDDDSTFEYKKRDVDANDDGSLFDFDDQKKPKAYNRKSGEKSAPAFAKPEKSDREYFTKREKNDSEAISEITSPSEASGSNPGNAKYGSFLSRLQACASPVFEENERGQSMPQAHLAFMRNSAKDSQDTGILSMIKNQALCGSTDNVQESDTAGLPPRIPSNAGSGTARGSTVASTYLQAIKEKTGSTTDWGKKDKGSDGMKRVSSVTSDSSSKSESWEKFLEKRNAALASGVSIKSDASSNSKAAEEYASAKVDEVISKITREGTKFSFDGSRRAKSTARLRPPSSNNAMPRAFSTGRARPLPSKSSQSLRKNHAAKAAEDLAAAKVEAMMSMISNSHLEGEI